jgi:hypothetical protein
MLNGEILPERYQVEGAVMQDGEAQIIWMVRDPDQEPMKGSERGVIFYIVKEGRYYFLPFDKKVYEVNFSDTRENVNIIWGDNPDKVFEKGFKFPSFEPQGSDNAPTKLGTVG